MNLRRLHPLFLASLMLLPLLISGCGGKEANPTSVPAATAPPQATIAVPTPTTPPAAPTDTPIPPTPTPADTGIKVLDVVFARGLSEEMQPQDPGTDFLSDETVHLSIKIKGRPKKGEVTAQFYWHDRLIAEANVDLGDVNSGVLFSIGTDTYAGYTLTHDPFPLSDAYHATVLVNGEPVGDYPFRVVPPADAIPTKITDVTLARDVDESFNPIEPATTFAPNDVVYLVGRGDLGKDTWIQAEWYVNGELDADGTRSLTLQENAADTPFSFSFLPADGWPTGEHSVVLIVNDEEIGRYTFSVE